MLVTVGLGVALVLVDTLYIFWNVCWNSGALVIAINSTEYENIWEVIVDGVTEITIEVVNGVPNGLS